MNSDISSAKTPDEMKTCLQELVDDFNRLKAQMDQGTDDFYPSPDFYPPKQQDIFPLNFSVTVSGNQATVVGGYWQGVYATTQVLTLAGATEWLFVSSSKQGTPAPIIGHIASTTKPQTDDSNYYVVLCRCYSSDLQNWSIVEMNYAGGDIDPKAPLL